MTIVVADTSPLNYLILIGEIGILSQLYERIVVPEEVFAELRDADAPQVVRAWAARYPGWIEIRKAPGPMSAIMGLDAGDSAAIMLAEWEADVLLLIDETASRREASRRGID